MRILVINGSPKGENSVTLQTVLYLEKHFPEHRFVYLHAGQRVRALEKDFSPAAVELEQAELLLFAYPVYTFLVPSQLHRFVELMKESGVSLAGKYASQISTSKHFYDITAHAFLEDNFFDMGLRVVRGLSADMEDLLSPKGRQECLAFFRHLLFCAERGLCLPERAALPAAAHLPVTLPPESTEKKDRRVAIVASDLADPQLAAMVEAFCRRVPAGVRVIDLTKVRMDGGCISCFHCSTKGECIYKDGFDRFLREEIQTSDAIVLAFTVRDHSMGSLFKRYDDRQFCNGHRTVTAGMPFGYLISGNPEAESNLMTVIRARAEVGGNYLAGVASDQRDPDGEIAALAENLAWAMENRFTQPANFWGVGGMKIFRDLIWQMQGMMKADHRFYKEHGLYDFPQKHRGKMLAMYLVGGLMSSPKLQAKAGGKMTEGMLAPYKKVLEKEE